MSDEIHEDFEDVEKLVNTLENILEQIRVYGLGEKGEDLPSLLSLSSELTTCATMFEKTLYARFMFLMLNSR